MARSFVNWARTVRATPARWAEPSDVAGVADVVRRAASDGLRVRVAGSGHSWSALVPTDGVLVSLRRMAAVVAVDRTAGVVRVQAGCTLHALLERLATEGLALPVVGSIDAQQVGGLIATGTHGSGLGYGNLASYVRRMVLVDGRGERVVLEGDDPRLVGGRVHLGRLGVVVEVDLAVVPAFKLRETVTRVRLDAVADTMEATARTHDRVKVWWLPHTDDAVVFTYTPYDGPDEVGRFAWGIDAALSAVVFPPVLALGGLLPAWIPTINRVVDRLKFSAGTRAGRADVVLKLPMPPRHRETEMVLPLSEGGAALRWCRDWLAEHRARCDFILEARFLPADDAWMSPSFGRESCAFGVYAARSPDTDRFFAAFQSWAASRGGRPHWGKAFDAPGRWPEQARFAELCAQVDPEGRFANPLTDRILG